MSSKTTEYSKIEYEMFPNENLNQGQGGRVRSKWIKNKNNRIKLLFFYKTKVQLQSKSK